MSIINKIKELINNFKSNTKLRAELEQKEKECEELHARTASIIHRLTGGRLTYSTYTLEGCEDAYTDQLRIDVERATKELQEENEELKKQLEEYQDQEPTIVNTIGNLQLQVKAWIEQPAKYKQALDEIKNYQQRNCETCVFANAQKCNINCQVFVILEIINQAKANKNKIDSKITNRDKLNRMSNEEFANWLTDNDDASELVNCKMCLFCASGKYDNGKWKCIQCCDENFRCKLGIIEWLNQESEQ